MSPSAAASPADSRPQHADQQSELLRKAVVSLERKLQERAAAAARAEAERDRLAAAQERWERDRVELEASAACAAQLRREGEERDAELGRAQGRAEGLAARCAALEAQVAELEAANARLAGQLAQWKGDREAAELGCIRARSQQQVQAAALAQLEAANEALRLDARQAAAKLQSAYEREAQLLGEIAQLKEGQRKAAAPAEPAPAAPAKPGDAATLDGLHRDLFLAAAQHMLREFSAKVAKAEGKAESLGQRLQGAEARFGQLAAHSRALQSQLERASGACRREEQAVQALLASNLRLHENLLQLMDQAAGAATAAAAGAAGSAAKERPQGRGGGRQYQRATHSSLGKQQQQQQAASVQQAVAVAATDCAGCCGEHLAHAPPGAAPNRQQREQQQQAKRPPCSVAAAAGDCSTPGYLARAAPRSLLSSRQGGALGCTAADPELGGAGSSCGSRALGGGCPQQAEAARSAAVDAALAISTEYRELHAYYKAVAAEVQRVSSCLAVACGQDRVQALGQQQGELQRELWDVADQLEAKVGQLAALKHARLL